MSFTRTTIRWALISVFGLVTIGASKDQHGISGDEFADGLTPGIIDTYSTIQSIGIEWPITGDDDHDASCTVQYKEIGSPTYRQAMPLYRVDFQGANMLAGSILFLKPATDYEVQLTLLDPDGGNSTMTKTVTTKSIPQMPAGGQIYHVVPGSGGGDGSQANPFQGVDAAETVAQAGDLFYLHGGNYGGVVFFDKGGTANNHIVWKAFGDGNPVFEGVRLEADNLWLEGLEIINQTYGLRTSPPGPKDVVVMRCFFYNNHYSIFLNDGGEGWYIADNIIIGDNIPNTSNFSGEGIELQHTSGHTVAYNTISRVADGISYPHKNVDMYGNDIFDTSDDGIEFDYGHANNRAWKNRISNLFNNGISFQPMDGAPYYVLYNQVAVLNGQSVLKLRDRSDRALIAHNTFIINSGPMASGANFLVNFEVKNNLWISINDRYAWENGTSSATNWKTDFDYDGFDWGNYSYAFKWGSNDRHTDIPAFYTATGQEQHGLAVDYATCFDTLNYNTDLSGNVDSFLIQYYTLKPTCNAVNAGILLNNINDDYLGIAPDLGAYEIGHPLPHYGVRTTCTAVEINKWIGSNGDYWNGNSSSWSLGRMPSVCDHILIESGKTVKIANGQIGLGLTLEVQEGGILITEGTGQLTIVIP